MVRVVSEQLVDKEILLKIIDLQQITSVVVTLGVGLHRGVPGAVVDVVQVVLVSWQCLGLYCGQGRGACGGW